MSQPRRTRTSAPCNPLPQWWEGAQRLSYEKPVRLFDLEFTVTKVQLTHNLNRQPRWWAQLQPLRESPFLPQQSQPARISEPGTPRFGPKTSMR